MQERGFGGLRVLAGVALLLGATAAEQARGQATPAAGSTGSGVVDHPLAPAGAASNGSDESLTVLGHHSRFQPAPMPGAPMGPPPDKPPAHLGRYKISGDQTKKDGYDTQTGAYIAPFGTAYTGAGPTADGLASRFQH